MARNLKLISVSPDKVIDGVNVIYAGTLDEALFGDKWHLVDYRVRSSAFQAWCRKNGAHYYAEEKHQWDEDGNFAGYAFSIHKGVRQAKRFGARTVVCENLS